ncbi:MAG: hypothetical protein C0594_05980 [Marinilabiliales bacterium]|nr:MAG: hypothetical protein C0594_05980 [Marinilabiliales bacterium]
MQFANGSGSDPNTAANLINQGFGNIRFTNPLNFDQRHQIQAAVDYRFGGKVSGRPYTGPKIREIDILADAGASLVVQAGSGKPYNKRDIRNDYLIGSINGSRMPWSNTINIRFDKDMKFQIGGKGDDGDKKDVYLNVYFDISNILNTANVRGVHSWTGNPDDDGYLHHADSQTAIENQYDEAAYRNYYAMYINYPWNYSRPRTILMGAMINF